MPSPIHRKTHRGKRGLFYRRKGPRTGSFAMFLVKKKGKTKRHRFQRFSLKKDIGREAKKGSRQKGSFRFVHVGDRPTHFGKSEKTFPV